MNKNIHIRFDWAIKKLLRQKANFEILEGFLSELLRDDVKIVEILESESNKTSAIDKQNRVDVLVKNSLGELVLIEVQNEREHDYFHRMAYGTSKLITQYLSEGEPYSEVKKVYSINIVYFNLGQGDDYIYEGKTQFVGLHKKDLLGLSENQIQKYGINEIASIFPTYFVLKLNSFDDIARDTLDEWIYFLKNNEIKDSFKAKGIQKAKEMLRIDSLPQADKEDYDAFVKEQRIRQNEIESAVFEEQLKTKKERQEKEAVIRNLSKVMSAEQIANITELEISYIQKVLSAI
jgi:predicted transposase/invertase (TIGR01784 family)